MATRTHAPSGERRAAAFGYTGGGLLTIALAAHLLAGAPSIGSATAATVLLGVALVLHAAREAR